MSCFTDKSQCESGWNSYPSNPYESINTGRAELLIKNNKFLDTINPELQQYSINYVAAYSNRFYETAPLETTGSSYAPAMQIPESDCQFEQQFTALGIPITEKSWAMQDRIDGGKLRAINNVQFLRNLPSELSEKIQIDKYEKLLDLNNPLPREKQAALAAELNELVRVLDDMDVVRDHFGQMSAEEFTMYQLCILERYKQLAGEQGSNASFFLDVPPTELAERQAKQGKLPEFPVGEHIGKTRELSARLAEAEQAQGRQTFGLVVPYENTKHNILANKAIPRDGVNNLKNYITELNDENSAMKIVASGYSQGATAILKYAMENGNKDGLDYAIATAPMGGIDLNGKTGIGSGLLGPDGAENGVPTLAISHQKDLASKIYPGHVLLGGLRFVLAGIFNRQRYEYHNGTHSINGIEHPELGTKGYPMDKVVPLAQQLIGGELGTTDTLEAPGQRTYQPREDWQHSIQNFQPHRKAAGPSDAAACVMGHWTAE